MCECVHKTFRNFFVFKRVSKRAFTDNRNLPGIDGPNLGDQLVQFGKNSFLHQFHYPGLLLHYTESYVAEDKNTFSHFNKQKYTILFARLF